MCCGFVWPHNTGLVGLYIEDGFCVGHNARETTSVRDSLGCLFMLGSIDCTTTSFLSAMYFAQYVCTYGKTSLEDLVSVCVHGSVCV